jgi:uncharacterized protein YecE (DUF72 family)
MNWPIVVHGLCGWSDPSLAHCGKVFPPRTSSSLDKLRFLSRYHEIGCLEVNSTTYAIPQQKSVQEWVHVTPNQFIFHVKAFGALCGSDLDLRQIPLPIRQKYQFPSIGRFVRTQYPEEAYSDLWNLFNDSLEPIVQAQKMGVVLFQFHTNFTPTPTSRALVEECANLLRPDVKMAVEFRDRNWIGWTNSLREDSADAGGRYEDRFELHETLTWLRSLRCTSTGTGVALVASDEIFSETFPTSSLPLSLHPHALTVSQSDASSLVPPPVPNAANTPRLPIFLPSEPTNMFLYIRIHRREGKERLLSETELRCWVQRIGNVTVAGSESVALSDASSSGSDSPPRCCCYMLWGTDFEDQPILNMKRLNELLPPSSRHEKTLIKAGGDSREARGIQSFFKKKTCDEESSQRGDHKVVTSCEAPREDRKESLRRERDLTNDPDEAPKKKTIRSYFVSKEKPL